MLQLALSVPRCVPIWTLDLDKSTPPGHYGSILVCIQSIHLQLKNEMMPVYVRAVVTADLSHNNTLHKAEYRMRIPWQLRVGRCKFNYTFLA